MPTEHVIIVDGYNVIHRVPRLERLVEASLENSRAALLRYCSEWRTRRREVSAFYVVFDGDSSVTDGGTVSAPGVRAVFTHTGETADTRILNMLERAGRRDRYTVVSDDNEVRTYARIHHMEWLSATDFCPPVPREPRHAGSDTDDDVKPLLAAKDIAAINADMRRHLGLD